MKKMVAVILLFFLLVLSVRGVAMFKKLRHASRLKIGVAKFKLLSVASQLGTQLILQISNFSQSEFNINQISVDVYTRQGELLASPKAPLQKGFRLAPNQNNHIPIDYRINLPILLRQVKNVGGLASLTANYLTSGRYGLTLVLKGFVTAENVTLKINETITV